MQKDDFAYGPLVAFLRARFVVSTGIPLIEAPLADVDEKRTLLEAVHRQHGEAALLEAGRAAAQLDGHPFLAAMLATSSPTALFSCWCSLEVLGHASNRVVIGAVGDTNVRLRRMTTTGGVPSMAEDLFIVGLLSGLLERLGATRVNAIPDNAEPDATGRGWTLQWTRFSRQEIAPSRSTWLVGSDFARAVLGYMLQGIDEGTRAPRMSEVAARFGLPGRTLQRRLRGAHTSFRHIWRAARVISAGKAIVTGSATSLTQVAHACGFADSAHLSREFRTIVAVAPSAFARSF